MGADFHRGSMVMTAAGILVYWYDWWTGITGITATLTVTGMIRMREDRHTHAHTQYTGGLVYWYCY